MYRTPRRLEAETLFPTCTPKAGPVNSAELDPNKTGPESSEEKGALLFLIILSDGHARMTGIIRARIRQEN